jgi:glycosyltransferase involved in cell wall biosynthesis
MKVVLVSSYTPTKENFGGISALPYHLLKDRHSDIEVVLFTYNLNNVSTDEIKDINALLNIDIHIMLVPFLHKIIMKPLVDKLLKLVYKYRNSSLLFPNLKYRNEIEKLNPDFIWIYPSNHYKMAKKMPNSKFLISGCDSWSLAAIRHLKDPYVSKNRLRSINMFNQFQQSINTEIDYNMKNTIIHFVGLEDNRYYNKFSGNNSFFLLHPHFELSKKNIEFNPLKLKILITGRNDLFVYTDVNALIGELINKSHELKDKITITIIGKGWNKIIQRLIISGYESNCIEWVDNYINEIIKYDVQIFPICVGTGTKGKVLDAIANGVLSIGSKIAFENICIRNMVHCVSYQSPQEIGNVIINIIVNKKKYELIAESGREQVRKLHSPIRLSNRFFEISNKMLMGYEKNI